MRSTLPSGRMSIAKHGWRLIVKRLREHAVEKVVRLHRAELGREDMPGGSERCEGQFHDANGQQVTTC